jgi:peptidoglycan/xylan/chitin deacetylase (PgdA/CDA1 family)
LKPGRRWMALVFLIAGFALVLTTPIAVDRQAPGPRIAITIDDLPWNGPAPAEGRLAATERLLEALADRGVIATGFVRCAGIGPDAPLLQTWLEHGMTLGNHSESHRDLNSAPLELWLGDVRTCDARLRKVVGGPVRYFRYPMLHQGPTLERREAALDLLHELDYEIAHVSVDNSEFMLSRPYEAALSAGDSLEARRIGALLVDHILKAVRHAQDVARRKVGRDVDHVLLLHATLMVSDHMASLLDALAAEGFRFVSLEEALSDPVYQLPDDYTGRTGLSWLYRIQPASPEDADWDDAQAARIRRALPP